MYDQATSAVYHNASNRDWFRATVGIGDNDASYHQLYSTSFWKE